MLGKISSIIKEKLKQVSPYDVLFGVLCIVYVGLLIHFAITRWESRNRYGILFLMFTMMIISLTSVKGKGKGIFSLKGKRQNVTATIFFLLAMALGIYFFTQFPHLVYERSGVPNTLDLVMSGLTIFLVILLCWHTSGRTIPIVILAFVAYALLGNHIPGFLYHPPISFYRLLSTCCAEIDGVFGSLNHIASTWIAIFVFFAGFVQGFGGLDYIIRLAFHLAERFKYALPQTAVISSMIFGCMSGSAAANAAGTGSFTIPTMKRYGMPGENAGAIEAVASSGGQIMPPILGAAAFIMCDYLGKNYYQIMAASFPPALLYFGCVALGVYFLAHRYMRAEKIEIPEEFKQKISLSYLLQGIPILVALIVLLYIFIVYKLDILTGGFFVVVSFLAARLIYELILSRGRPSAFWNSAKGIFAGAKRGTVTMLQIGVMLAGLGIVVKVLVNTGLAAKLSFFIVDSFGGNLPLLMIAIMIVCILFGMAVTTVAAYVLVVTIAAPALLAIGIPPLQAHFSVFYWAILSGITPPVAAVCVITSGIAKSNFFKTCWESIKLGVVLFILPFVFCTQPGLLLFSRETIAPFFMCAIGLLGIIIGLQSSSGSLWGAIRRVLLIVLGGIGIFYPTGLVTWGCLGAVVVLLVLPWLIKNLSARKQISEANTEKLK